MHLCKIFQVNFFGLHYMTIPQFTLQINTQSFLKCYHPTIPVDFTGSTFIAGVCIADWAASFVATQELYSPIYGEHSGDINRCIWY